MERAGMPAPVSLPQRVLRPSGRRVRALKRTTPSAGLGHMDVRAWSTSAHQPRVSASVGIRQRSSGWLGDWAHLGHICTGARPCHICPGTELACVQNHSVSAASARACAVDRG
jgi:hypothetical protein